MASARETVDIIFAGIDNASGTMNSIERGISDLESSIGGVTAPLANAADFVLKLDAALVGLGTAMAAVSVNEAGKLSDAFNEISTLIDAPREGLNQFKGDISDYARESTQSFDDINAAVYNAISAGTDYKDSLDLLATSEQLAVGGKTDLNSATVLLASSLNAYGEATDEAAGYSDALFTAVKFGQTTIPELQASLSQVTGTAAAAGVPFSDLTAAVAALTASGAPTSQAVTGIKAALSNIIKPTSDAEKAASDLGVEFGVTALQTKGLDGLLGDLYEATGGNITQMGRFFGSTEALNSVMVLAADSSGKFAAALDAMESRAGATTAAFEKMVDNFALINQNLRNNLQATLADFGERLLDQYKGTASASAEVLKSLGRAIDNGAFDPLLAIINAFGKDAETVFLAIADNLEEALQNVDWSGLERALDGLGDAFGDLFGNVDFTTAEGLEKAIQGIITAGELLIGATDGIVRGFKPFFEVIIDAAEWIGKLDSDTIAAGATILGFAKGIDTVVLPILATLALGFYSIKTALGAVSAASTGLSTLTTAVGGASVATTGLSGALGKAGLAGAAAFSVLKIGELIGILMEWKEAAGEAADATERADKVSGLLDSRLAEISSELGITIKNMDEFNKLQKDGVIVADEATGKWKLASEALRDQGEAVKTVDFDKIVAEATAYGDVTDRINALLAPQNKKLTETGEIVSTLAEETGKAAESVRTLFDDEGNIIGFTDEVGEAENAVSGFGGAAGNAGKDVAGLGDEAKVSADKIAELENDLKKAELQAFVDLNTAGIEAGAEVAIAEVEAMARGIEATMSSVSDIFQSTGDVIGDVLDGFSSANSWNDVRRLEEQLKKENKYREDTLEITKKTAAAQIELWKAQAKRISDGNLAFKVSADGLEPHLAAIWREILKAIQAEASAEGAEFLIGACGGNS